MEKQPQPGTVICGTHRRQDLIPKYLELVREYAPAQYWQMIVTPFGPVPAHADEDDAAQWWDDEDAGFLLEELTSILEDVAPEGHYFGAHPGDGADFGFWELEADI